MTKRVGLLIGLVIGGVSTFGWGADVGSVSGKVTLKGAAPAVAKVTVSTDTAVCGAEYQPDEVVVGADKGIKYAVVRLVGVKGTPVDPAKPVELQQKGCRFNPHVVVMPKGGTLDILNDDGISHNLHTRSKLNPEINKAQPGFKKRMSQKFEDAEMVKVTCDIHTWMSSYVVVTDDGFVAITDASGAFKLPNVPPGNYKLEVWHEKLGTQTKDVVVKATADAAVSFELTGS